jgi:hypothetical protein
MGRPEYHKYELQIVNCIEAIPILVGTAIFMYYAYPPFYYWHSPPRQSVIAVATTTTTTINLVQDGDNTDQSDGLQSLL